MANESLVNSVIDNIFVHTSQLNIERSMRSIISGEDRIYAARVLDYRFKHAHKIKARNDIIWRQQNEPRVIAGDPFAQGLDGVAKAFDAIDELQVASFNVAYRQLLPNAKPVLTKKQAAQERRQRETAHDEDRINRISIAYTALKLTTEETKQLYPNVTDLYKKQVHNRKWYQRTSFYIAMGCLATIFSPLVYLLWKRNRNKELIQPNPHSKADHAIIIENRKAFKGKANSQKRAEVFITTKEKNKTVLAGRPQYVTKYKKERDEFFLKHKFSSFGTTVKEKQIDEITASKEKDREERFRMGMQ